jgi:hypothetical protein
MKCGMYWSGVEVAPIKAELPRNNAPAASRHCCSYDFMLDTPLDKTDIITSCLDRGLVILLSSSETTSAPKLAHSRPSAPCERACPPCRSYPRPSNHSSMLHIRALDQCQHHRASRLYTKEFKKKPQSESLVVHHGSAYRLPRQ